MIAGIVTIFSVVLRNKSYCIFNRQFTKEDYFKELKKYKAWPKEKVFATVEDIRKRLPKTQTVEYNNENTAYGNFLFDSKDCYYSFDAAKNEKCAYMYDSHRSNMSYDASYSGLMELCYEIVDCAWLFNCNYVVYSRNCQDSSYLYQCIDVKNSLGCVGLSHKQYCILNRQFTKEKYESISRTLYKDLQKKKLGWGNIRI